MGICDYRVCTVSSNSDIFLIRAPVLSLITTNQQISYINIWNLISMWATIIVCLNFTSRLVICLKSYVANINTYQQPATRHMRRIPKALQTLGASSSSSLSKSHHAVLGRRLRRTDRRQVYVDSPRLSGCWRFEVMEIHYRLRQDERWAEQEKHTRIKSRLVVKTSDLTGFVLVCLHPKFLYIKLRIYLYFIYK